MQDSEIYTKTEAGREEIRSRALKLSMAMRAILVMVDGQRTVAELRTIIAGSKAPTDTLDTLLAQGLIVARDVQVQAASTPQPARTPSAPTPTPAPPTARVEPETAAPVSSDEDSVDSLPIDVSSPSAFEPPSPRQTDSDAALAPRDDAPVEVRSRYDRLYTSMNEIVRDFLPAYRRYFIQLKIERCTTADELLEVLQDLRIALAKSRGDAFASDVIARLRSAAM